MDHFTKWADAFPIIDHKAHTVAKVLLDRLFSRFGMPEELLSDQDPEFESELIAEWCKALGVRKIRTSPYRPTTNGMLERFHRTLNQMIGKVASEGQRDWDEYVQPVLAAYRASEHVVTGFSPNLLMPGREVRAPIDLVLGRPVEKADRWESTNEFVAEVQERYRRAYEIAGESLQVDAKRRKDLYDRRILQRRFPVGTLIWYYYPSRYVGRTPKWSKTYIAPMLVVEVVSATNVRIKRNRRSKSMLEHVDKVKLCKGDTPKAWLSE